MKISHGCVVLELPSRVRVWIGTSHIDIHQCMPVQFMPVENDRSDRCEWNLKFTTKNTSHLTITVESLNFKSRNCISSGTQGRPPMFTEQKVNRYAAKVRASSAANPLASMQAQPMLPWCLQVAGGTSRAKEVIRASQPLRAPQLL